MGESTDREPKTDGRSGADDSTASAEFDPTRVAWDPVPAPLLVVDDAGMIVRVNTAFADRFGYTDGIVGEPIGAVCPSLSVEDLQAGCNADGPRTELDTHARLSDGTECGIRLDVERQTDGVAEWYVAVVHDVTELQSRLRTLERYERIVETIDDGVYVLDSSFDIISVNDAVPELTGYSRSELVGSNASLLASEETLEQAATISEALLTSEIDAATITTTLETADGGELPVETRFSVYQFGDGSHGHVGVIRDISDRLRYEQTLTALHDSTRELLHTETRDDVCDLVVDMATDVIDLSAAAVYLFDTDANVLRPVAMTADSRTSLADLSPVGPGGGALWDSFVTGERRIDSSGLPLGSGGDIEPSSESGIYLPLGDYGLLFVAMRDDDRLNPDTTELIDLVAASAEAGLERVDREERIRKRDRELRERNERLGRLQEINEIIRRIDQALVGADSRAAVESAVCEELSRSDLCSFAWIGQVDGETVVPNAWAGDAPRYLDVIDRSLDGEGGPPAVRTARTDETTLVPSIASDLREDTWRREALSRDFQSAISVPINHDDVTYGMLTAYAPQPDDFGETIQSVFLELGETIGNAFRALETKQWLSAESVVELDLAIEAPGTPLTVIASEADTTLVHEGTVRSDDGVNRTFLRVDDADFERVRDTALRQTVVEAVNRRSATDEDPRVELHLSTPTVPTTVTDQDSRIQSLAVRPTGIDATVELAPTASVREFVETLDRTYQSATVRARRDRTAPASGSVSGFRTAAKDHLTDRQWQVIRAAYLSGFYDWPRTTTGEEIADAFDVSQPTINRHLRVGERKLLERLFDGD